MLHRVHVTMVGECSHGMMLEKVCESFVAVGLELVL